MFRIKLDPCYEDLVVKLDKTRKEYLCLIEDIHGMKDDRDKLYLCFRIPLYMAYAPTGVLDELIRYSIGVYAGEHPKCPLKVRSYLKSYEGSRAYLDNLCYTDWGFLGSSLNVLPRQEWADSFLPALYEGEGRWNAPLNWALDIAKQVTGERLDSRYLRIGITPQLPQFRQLNVPTPYVAADCITRTILVSQNLEPLVDYLGPDLGERALNYIFLHIVAYFAAFDWDTCQSNLEVRRRILKRGHGCLTFSKEEWEVIYHHFNAYSIWFVRVGYDKKLTQRFLCDEYPWVRPGYGTDHTRWVRYDLMWNKYKRNVLGKFMGVLEKMWGQNSNLAVEIYGRYNGHLYKGIDVGEVTAEALKEFNEIICELGGEYIDIGDGYDVRPDYFPILDPEAEIFEMGFVLYFHNNEVGRIRTLKLARKGIEIHTARTKIILERDITAKPPPNNGNPRALFSTKTGPQMGHTFEDLLSEQQRQMLENLLREQEETTKLIAGDSDDDKT